MSDLEISHYPVMKSEILEYLKLSTKLEHVLDCTAGEGGHSLAVLEEFPESKLIFLDRDPVMLERARTRLDKFQNRIEGISINYSEFADTFHPSENRKGFDGIIMDLGISTHHIKHSGRGFSFQKDEDLDMRLTPNEKKTAREIINRYSSSDLEEIFLKYGEENWSRKIAQNIVETRKRNPFETTGDLAKIVEKTIPRKFWPPKVHPAFRIFQAVRIEVNSELKHIEKAIPGLSHLLNPGGIIAILSFHSLEDRIVKNEFKNLAKQERFKILTKKPILPNEKEVAENPASRSAKLRVLQA